MPSIYMASHFYVFTCIENGWETSAILSGTLCPQWAFYGYSTVKMRCQVTVNRKLVSAPKRPSMGMRTDGIHYNYLII